MPKSYEVYARSAFMVLTLLAPSAMKIQAQVAERSIEVAIAGSVGTRSIASESGRSTATTLSVALRPSGTRLAVIAEAARTNVLAASRPNFDLYTVQLEHGLPLIARAYANVGFGRVTIGRLNGTGSVFGLSYRIPLNNSVELTPRISIWKPNVDFEGQLGPGYYLSTITVFSIQAALVLH